MNRNEGIVQKFKSWVYQFMAGRYGMDQLGYILVGSGILFTLIGFAWAPMCVLSILVLGFEIYRILSKNPKARSKENDTVMGLFSGGKKKGKATEGLRVVCPECGQGLRIPRGKGRILITCPSCNHKFATRS